MIRTNGTIYKSLLYLHSTVVHIRLEYDYSVISVIVDSLPGNTRNQESTRSWLIGVRLFHRWADLSACVAFHPCMFFFWPYGTPLSLRSLQFLDRRKEEPSGQKIYLWDTKWRKKYKEWKWHKKKKKKEYCIFEIHALTLKHTLTHTHTHTHAHTRS